MAFRRKNIEQEKKISLIVVIINSFMQSLNITINQKSNIPLYKQIAQSISIQIDKGKIIKGAILPSINVFSKRRLFE